MSSFNKRINEILEHLKFRSKKDLYFSDAELSAIYIFSAIYRVDGGAVVVVENSAVLDRIFDDLRQFLSISLDGHALIAGKWRKMFFLMLRNC